ncbi:hypothetical protein OESDEN_23761, partial [Oesophagostomum dentatum]
MAGVPITLVGCASLEFQIGNSIITETVHFTDGSCIPREADAFNIIMGNNVLSALPPWTIDYTRKTFTLDGEPVKILCMLPNETQPDGDVIVRVLETTVLQPGTETYVPCHTSATLAVPVILVTQTPDLLNKSLLVAPSVFHTGLQFTSRADCHKTSALPDNVLVDLSRAEVTDAEKEQLRALFMEFRDRISLGPYDLGSYDHEQIKIKTTTEIPPTRFRPTRIPVKFQKELDDQINKLLKAGRIKESDTPWVHNTVPVKKRDGSLR